jgi:uncharacterized protein YbjT (DUF2867 family)
MPPIPRKVFLTGATGYMGRRLIPMLLERGHSVTALARPGSESKLEPSGAAGLRIAPGDALDGASLRNALGDCDTWVQLIGTPHPSPAKAAQFQAVDRRAVTASIEALPGSSVGHYVYLSVAHPAPAMRAYVKVREEGEALLKATGLKVTCMRPWYVLGPGHRWPCLLIPVYKVMELIPATREGALRLGLVTLPQMIRALVRAVENPPGTARIVPVPEIRRARL